MTQSEADARWMARCETLAREALREGEAPVGAVVVREEICIAQARETVVGTRDVLGHAEILALRAACRALNTLDLTGCTLYTTTEPCFSCSFALRELRVSEVVIGTPITGIGGVSSAHPILCDVTIPEWTPPPHVRWMNGHELPEML